MHRHRRGDGDTGDPDRAGRWNTIADFDDLMKARESNPCCQAIPRTTGSSGASSAWNNACPTQNARASYWRWKTTGAQPARPRDCPHRTRGQIPWFDSCSTREISENPTTSWRWPPRRCSSRRRRIPAAAMVHPRPGLPAHRSDSEGRRLPRLGLTGNGRQSGPRYRRSRQHRNAAAVIWSLNSGNDRLATTADLLGDW